MKFQARATCVAVVLLLCLMSFAWGALTVHRHIWPYPLLARFGDRPTLDYVSKEHRRVRTVHASIQGHVDTVFLGDASAQVGAPMSRMRGAIWPVR